AALAVKRAEPFRLRSEDFFPSLAVVRERAARLIGATAKSIALMTNTTHGEFPANVYPWMAAARARGAEHRLLPLAGDLPDEGALMRAIETDPRVKVVALSWVSFWSGHRFDLAAIGAACRSRGIWFFVDAIQGLAPLTLDVASTHVDILSCGGQKWLCSPWGTGFTYVREELLTRLDPAEVGWMAQPASADFGRFLAYDPTLYDDARRFEVVTLDFVSFLGLSESLGLFLEL